jgi:predicted NAD/FAD-dependent oxidoreductase
MNAISNVAIIGAGMAGLACATALTQAGVTVSLFDKGRRPGGRLATRRADGLMFDHGAQYASAQQPEFTALLERMRAAGVAAPWDALEAERPRWVGIPGMSAIARFMADQLPPASCSLATERHVAFVRRDAAGWHLRHLPAATTRPGTVVDDGDQAGPFDAMLVALPSPQAGPLLAALGHRFAADADRAVIAPCWAVMLAFADPVDAPVMLRPTNGPLAWVARDSARPGRPAAPETWMLHASPAWSEANLERPAADVAADLLHEFRALTGATAAPLHLSAHRWRYAQVTRALDQSCLWDADAGLGACGDWCLGPRVEAAYLSGRALATAVLSRT